MSRSNFCFTFDDYFGTFNANNLTCSFVDKILDTRFNNASGETATDNFFKSCFINFYFFGETESFENIFIGFVTDSA